MKVILTGGGTGGHFYPLIAVAEEINAMVREEKLLPVDLYYLSDAPHDADMLVENNIRFVRIFAGKLRRYFSLLNIVDLVKTFFGVIGAMIEVYRIFPDVVFSKGAYVSFPVVLAARFFGIPVVIHESDSVPGRANAWAGKFAKRIAVSYPQAAKYFDQKKVAVTGNPIRTNVRVLQKADAAREFFGMKENIPVLLVVGGSLGARVINDTLMSIIPSLVDRYYVIHQIGKGNMQDVLGTANVVLADHPHKDRYRPFDYLDNLNMSMAAGAANLVISRAGSAIFEIANWGLPSILIPITNTNGDHQRQNAYFYAESGGATVIEEGNLSPTILLSEIKRIMDDPALSARMSAGAKNFVKTDAAHEIAGEILRIALSHEQ
ncbi:MAG: UDP-N-acetylglucosamine--N-acetylmuramyl-(pentapeptide) pyrophosphoryl-undecaprenol N-acetylglucosamine transferase [Patescibacteria group bacterium]|nr:UDP-N-acetylglucosamine--N-acetylmuramyl-(pentapeptide) pyrophosphoryl-undecaprenol N-acetylglucosamine transferase [Patescibacteria group bacterium]MDE1945929.1 UDP-N-acetylglucosamine--N-acetylmuramyl-(pentapeptide) pyrophosphoryl-undecaprenol N-acetylglucosamine transferase [Patescibacteria group bacterium]